MRIEEINNTNSKIAYDFLSGVPSIEKIDEHILSNAVLAFDNNKIIGCISFEEYDSIGLIRYFVFSLFSLSVLDAETLGTEATAKP